MNRFALRAVAALVLSVAVAACGADGAGGDDAEESPSSEPTETRLACDAPCYGDAATLGSVSADTAIEVSGIAASVRTPGAYYVVSDEAGTSQVAVVQADGELVGRIEVAGMDAANAEALEVGPCGDAPDESCLYVGDIGDHVGRDDVVIYRLREPAVDAVDPVPADALRYTYADGPTDAEALMVDDEGRPLIVSKGETTRLYHGPASGGVFERVGEIDLPEPEDGLFADVVGNVVTGASAASGRVLLRTYDEVLEYRAEDDEAADLTQFPRWSWWRVPAGLLVQAEAITYRVDECGYLTVSELTGAIAGVPCAGNVPTSS